ncbi:hypothetical protein, partial [Brevibacterium casei]|uniref:hypothetical protein n=1 Tax=Brevibacterium casei TaxID=33889 RepID=UPI001C92C9FC
AVVPTLTGRACVTGTPHYFLHPSHPFPARFLLSLSSYSPHQTTLPSTISPLPVLLFTFLSTVGPHPYLNFSNQLAVFLTQIPFPQY